MAPNGTPIKRPRLAAVVTSYKKYLHPQHVVDRFLDGYGWNGTFHHSEMDVVSLYVDQRGEGDLFQERAARHPKFSTVYAEGKARNDAILGERRFRDEPPRRSKPAGSGWIGHVSEKGRCPTRARSFVLNHLIHHRAILCVYLRLNNIPVPGMYGPSGDE